MSKILATSFIGQIVQNNSGEAFLVKDNTPGGKEPTADQLLKPKYRPEKIEPEDLPKVLREFETKKFENNSVTVKYIRRQNSKITFTPPKIRR